MNIGSSRRLSMGFIIAPIIGTTRLTPSSNQLDLSSLLRTLASSRVVSKILMILQVYHHLLLSLLDYMLTTLFTSPKILQWSLSSAVF
jgi:hypothetical protein